MPSDQDWDRVAYIGPNEPVPADGSMVSPTRSFHAHVESYKDDHFEDGGTFPSAEAAIAVAGAEQPPVLVHA